CGLTSAEHTADPPQSFHGLLGPPLDGNEIWTDDVAMFGRILVCDVMRKVSAVADDHILALNLLAGDPPPDLGVSVRALDRVEPILDLVAVISQDPDVSPPAVCLVTGLA